MIISAVILSSLLLLSPQDKKLPVPEPAAQKEAEKLVRDIFKEDYSKKNPAARIALAKKLLQQGIETKDNENACFVLLREAGDLFALSGETELALRAISELAKRFRINSIETKAAALATAGKSMKTIDEFAALGKSYLSLTEEALSVEEFDSAERAAATGGQFSKKGKDLPTLSRLDAKAKEAGELRNRSAKVNKAMETLGKNAEDAEAHFLVGQYLALVKGDWDEGLKHLVRGNEAALKAAAEKDLSKPSDPGDQIAVGDLWWDLGEKEGGAGKGRLISRAGYWYLKARNQTSGLTRTRMDKRLDAAGMLPPARPAVDLLKLIDLQQDTVQGRWQFQNGKLISPAVFMARVQIPYTPPEEYDIHVTVESDGKQDSLNMGLVVGESRVLAVIDGWDPKMSVLGTIEERGETEAVHKGRILAEGRPNTIVYSVRKNRLTVKVNDTTIIDWPADYRRCSLENVWQTPNSKTLMVGAYLSIYQFTKISLIPVTGEGKSLR
jgi:hypothetical protein